MQDYRGNSKNMSRKVTRKRGDDERLHCRRLCVKCIEIEIPFNSKRGNRVCGVCQKK